MADTVKVNLEENSKYRVAYDLALLIARQEGNPQSSEKAREYLLRLYRQCYDTVYGYEDIETIIRAAK